MPLVVVSSKQGIKGPGCGVPDSMDTLGLVQARQLFDIEDLHYGLWQQGLGLKLANAQQRYKTYPLLLYRLPHV